MPGGAGPASPACFFSPRPARRGTQARMSRAKPPRIAPSDAAALGDLPAVEIAGRAVIVPGGDPSLADAFAAVRVHVDRGALAPGDLAIVSGSLSGGELRDATVVERIAPLRPPAIGPAHDEEDPGRSETERLIARGLGKGLRARAQGLAAIRAFFEARGFLEVETPAIVPSPGLDVHLDAFTVPGVAGPGFSDRTGYLITSPEYQMKRLLAGGIPRCFQLAHCFRQGEIGRRHNPEFLMLEWYRAFASAEDLIDETEALVRHVALALAGGSSLQVGDQRVDLSEPFERLPVGEAFARYAGVAADDAIALATSDEDRFFRLLVDRVEPALAGEPRPIFLVDYPAPFASLARLKPGDPRVAERFELYVAGIELCNGFGELTDPREQRARLLRDQADRARLGKPVYPIDERFLAALEEGMPPAAGNALGVDRLLAVCLGTERIAAVQAFPVEWL
jgi:elongation factor P--(R)-beta-lysine ligase